MLEFTPNTSVQDTSSPQAMEVPTFGGFHSLQANFLYCPNQFFDVLLPHYSRGCVRLVGYMIRQTLGYLDADGNPLHAKLDFTYNDLIEGANIARGAIRDTLDEATKAGFIECSRTGKAHSAGKKGNSALYALRWNAADPYTKDPAHFSGFFEGDGNRTTIPNDFFDVVVKHETLSVSRVVGTIIRNTIGFQNPKGGRRQQIQFSFDQIKRNTGIQQNTTVVEALERAVFMNFIAKVSEGIFSTQGRAFGVASTYAVRWFESGDYTGNGSKNLPKKSTLEFPERFKKHTEEIRGGTVQKTHREAFKKHTEEAFKKHTNINNNGKDILKQQQQAQPEFDLFAEVNAGDLAAAAWDVEAFHLLQAQGFDEKAARHLASAATPETIKKQVEWMARRSATKNKLGMLRLAILENWKEPVSLESAATDETSPAFIFAKYAYAGHSGQSGAPTARPSEIDAKASQSLVGELLAIWPDSARVPEFGRQFGQFWREKEERGRLNKMTSLSAALRLFGDSFRTELERRKVAHFQRVNHQTREAHEAKFKPAWIAYLKGEENRIRGEQADAYADFQARRTEELMRQLNSPMFVGNKFESLRGHITRHHDSEEVRLSRFREFFQEEVADFWAWDKTYNSTPLS